MTLALAANAWAQGAFEWRDTGQGHVELRENGKPALVYNYGMQLKQGAPENRRRCCYIFPLYTPGGVAMLDDFPQDHEHHRGVFWSWPVVETRGKQYDHWMNMTARNRPLDAPTVNTSARGAQLNTSSIWEADGQDVMHEYVVLTVYPSRAGARDVDVRLTLEALGAPVTLRGSREQGKSYGGFSARFAAREGTILRADGQVVKKDEDLNPHRWAELEGSYGGKRAVLRITPDASDPGAPYQWCLRTYGFVGASFPGRTASSDGYTVEPEQPVVLKFRLSVRDVP